MSDPFQGPLSKITRAGSHLVELEKTEREFFQHTPASTFIETNIETGHKLLKLRLESLVPDIVSILAAEIIYHLRSSLDQIAVAFARISAEKPNPRNIHFPTGDNIVSFEAACKNNLAKFDADLADEIRKTNAYSGGDDVLRSVFSLANVDKHWELIPVGTVGGLAGLSNFTIQNGHTGLILGTKGSLRQGIVISDLGTNGTFAPKNPHAKIYVNGQITLGNVGEMDGKPLAATLRDMTTKASSVINHLRAHCIKTGRL